MSIFSMFGDRYSKVSVTGKPDEDAVITRRGRSETPSIINNTRTMMLDETTTYANGDLLTVKDTGDTYFLTALQKSQTGAIQCQLRKTNCIIDIVKIAPHYIIDAKGIKQHDCDVEVPLYTSQVAMYEELTAKMIQYDLGIVPKATRRFLIPMLNIELLHRIKLNGKPMQVEDISTSKYPGLLSVQTSNDTRPTKVV